MLMFGACLQSLRRRQTGMASPSAAGAPLLTEIHGPLLIVTINRPERRNAVDRETAEALSAAFRAFDGNPDLSVAILTGAGGTFCAGADLRAIAEGKGNQINAAGDGPMGPTRMTLKKPVIAAIEGHAVAGGLELALWCDLRVAARDATFGVFCRRFGVPLIDGGTVRLPRLIGAARAMDMILTGRAVAADEAFQWGLANRLAEPGKALADAIALARELAGLPQICLRHDRASALAQWALPEDEAMAAEFRLGLKTLESGETLAGATRFTQGEGKSGAALTNRKETS